jgi:hypothetical protein
MFVGHGGQRREALFSVNFGHEGSTDCRAFRATRPFADRGAEFWPDFSDETRTPNPRSVLDGASGYLFPGLDAAFHRDNVTAPLI